MWTVYMHTCPNGKRYVGITSKKPAYRWAKGNGYKKQVFYNAIKKYGWDNIKHEIIAEVETVEEAAEIETKYIREYRTFEREYGYNMSDSTIGRHGLPKARHSQESKDKMSEIAKQRPMESRNLTGLMEHRHVTQKGEKRNHSPEGKRKIREFNGKPVVQYEIILVPINTYDTATTARKENGIHVNNSLHWKCKSGGYIWKHIDELTDVEINEIYNKNIPHYYEDNDRNIIRNENGANELKALMNRRKIYEQERAARCKSVS